MKKIVLLIGGLIFTVWGITYIGSGDFFAPYSATILIFFGIVAVTLGLTLRKK